MAERAAIYCRVSKEDDDKRNESESIRNQKILLINYAKEKGWEIYRVYSDDDYSGVDRTRPGFNQMIEDAEKGKFTILICKTQSRFTRDMELVEKYLHGSFPLWGIRFIAIVDNVDTDIRGSKKTRQINGLINEWYLEDLSENIRAVLTSKRKQGKYIGSFAAYGYKKDPADHNRLELDPEAADTVKRIFQMHISGYGIHAIAQTLNSENIPNPTHYKIEKGIINNRKDKPIGRSWSDFTVRSMLKNQIYAGDMVQGINRNVSFKSKKQIKVSKEHWIVVSGTHEPIIDKAVFEQAQKLFDTRFGSQNKRGGAHILNIKARCFFCGSPLQKNTAKGKEYLRCRSREKECSRGIPLGLAEEAVLSKMHALASGCEKDPGQKEMAKIYLKLMRTNHPTASEMVDFVAVGKGEDGIVRIEIYWKS